MTILTWLVGKVKIQGSIEEMQENLYPSFASHLSLAARVLWIVI